MAEEDSGDKTEAPTPRRRLEAREQGNVARSPDLTSAAQLIGILVLLKIFGGGVVSALRLVLDELLSAHSLSNLNPAGAPGDFVRAVAGVGIAMMPLFVGMVLIAIAVNLAQVGFNLNFNRLTPNAMALNPFRGLSRIFGRGRGVVQLILNSLKVLMVGLVAYSAVHGRMADIVSVQRLSFQQIFGMSSAIVYAIALRIGILLLVLAFFDYAYQRYRLEQELKMSKQEVKEEMKRMDGDPKVKRQRRQIALQRHLQRLKKEVPKADVIVTNPTHFAVALQYESTMRAPKVVAKGQDYMAIRIREIAVEVGIPSSSVRPLPAPSIACATSATKSPRSFIPRSRKSSRTSTNSAERP
jgi:flagellar biosynthetic protein FlhB